MKMPIEINKNTLVPISIVGAIIVGVLWMNNQFSSIKYELQTLSAKVSFVESHMLDVAIELEEESDKCWPTDDMRNWAGMLQALNPDMLVPEATTEQYRGLDANNNLIDRR
jgi:hypothetical protein